VRAPSFADTMVDSVTDRLPDHPGQQLEALLEEAGLRGGAAWDALRGERVGPPVAARRWPWAVAAAVAGAAAGVAVAMIVRRLAHEDPPGAQDPEDLEAVIDRPGS
jgi:hypothetical protein